MATSRSDDDLRWIPVRSAARRLGVSCARVYQLLHEGQLSSIKMGCTYMVLSRSVDARIVMLRDEAGDPDGRW